MVSFAIYYSSASYRKAAFYNRLSDKAKSTTMLILEPNRVLEIKKYNPDKLYNEKILIFNSLDNLEYGTDSKHEIKPRHDVLDQVRMGHKVFYEQHPFEILGMLYHLKNDDFVVIVAATDKDGYLYVTGRIKNVIVSAAGMKVYPEEVEEVLKAHEAVHDALVVGVPDERSGEAVKVVIVAKDASLTKESVIAHCKLHLTGYKVPRHVEFRDAMPKTPIGKILRRELRVAPRA